MIFPIVVNTMMACVSFKMYAVHQVKTFQAYKLESTRKIETIYYERNLGFWGDCLFREYGLEGIKLAANARDEVLNTPEKRRKNLELDRVFAWKISKTAPKSECDHATIGMGK